MSRRYIVFAVRLMGLLSTLHVYYLPLMSLNSHRSYMLAMFLLKFDNLCRDHEGVLNARYMAIKLKIVDLHILYVRIVDRRVILPRNSLRALILLIVFTVVETMVQIPLTVQLILSKKRRLRMLLRRKLVCVLLEEGWDLGVSERVFRMPRF